MHASAAKKGKMTEAEAVARTAETMGRLTFASSTGAIADVDLVVEAIVEKMEVKSSFYEALGKTCAPSTLFASNTSSLQITPIALASGRPEKFVGLHYFNPVQLMPLVEVVRTPHTDPAVFAACEAFAQKCGKQTVDCKDTPGFIVNRLLVPNIAQAIAMVDRRDATIEDVDKAMKLGAGHPMGPIALADYVGLDTCLSILSGWCSEYPGEPAFIVPDSLKAKVAAGKLGRKSGEGYYAWGDGVASTKPTAVSQD